MVVVRSHQDNSENLQFGICILLYSTYIPSKVQMSLIEKINNISFEPKHYNKK